jgi:addiction module RelB/DinJ family antitoxin
MTTTIWRCRVEPDLLKQAQALAKSLGTSLSESVRIILAEMVSTGRIPVSIDRKANEEAAQLTQVKRALEAFERTLMHTEDGATEEAAGTRLVKRLRAIFSKDGAGEDAAAESVESVEPAKGQ